MENVTRRLLVAEAVEALQHVSRPRLVDMELGMARPEIAAALMREVHKRERHGLRQRLNCLTIPGSAGLESFGALVRMRKPMARRSIMVERDGVISVDEVLEVARGWVDDLLDMVDAVEKAETSADEHAAWESLREWWWWNRRWDWEWCLSDGRWRPLRGQDGPREHTAFWIAAREAAGWLVARHRGFDLQLDGRLPRTELKLVLEGLGWPVKCSLRTLVDGLEEWEERQPLATGAPPVGWRPVRLGRRLFFYPPATRALARRGKRR